MQIRIFESFKSIFGNLGKGATLSTILQKLWAVVSSPYFIGGCLIVSTVASIVDSAMNTFQAFSDVAAIKTMKSMVDEIDKMLDCCKSSLDDLDKLLIKFITNSRVTVEEAERKINSILHLLDSRIELADKSFRIFMETYQDWQIKHKKYLESKKRNLTVKAVGKGILGGIGVGVAVLTFGGLAIVGGIVAVGSGIASGIDTYHICSYGDYISDLAKLNARVVQVEQRLKIIKMKREVYEKSLREEVASKLPSTNVSTPIS